MTEPQQPMIELTRPSGVKETAQTLLGGLFADAVRLGGAASGFGQVTERARDLAKRLVPDDTPEESGWRLVYAGLERAIDEAAKPLLDFPASPERLRVDHLMQLGGERIAFDVIEIPPHFLRQPKDLALLGQVGPILEGSLARLGLDARMAAERADLLPGLFVAALADLWSKHQGSLEALERLTNSPFDVAARQERFWHFYREKLERDLAPRPLFAGRLSLLDLYQKLRGYRRARKEGERGYIHHVVDLKSEFDRWLETFDPEDAIRVVTGGPGSGKSSFVKWWAAEVLRREPLIPVLVVPLHRLRTFDLEAEIGRFARNEGFAKNPVGVHEGEPRLLLVLDGLDELDADQTRGQAAASHLVSDVHRLLAEVNGRGDRDLRVVLAGREVIVTALENEIGEAERQVFHVLGYLDGEGTDRLDRRHDALVNWVDPDELRSVDQRQSWWRNWGERRGEALDDAPAAIVVNKQLAELSDQPLLNHLLALTHSETPGLLDAKAGMNTVYAGLLRHVWRRSWGAGARGASMRAQLPGVRGLSEADFQRVFESIGLAVWQYGGGRSINLAQVEAIADAEGVRQQLSAVRAAAEDEALDLLTAFYFKREGAAETFELTHKSFGEYFVASRLMRLIEELHVQLAEDEIDGVEALRRWYRWTYAARITPEIIGFLKGELHALSLDEVRARRATLIRLFNRNLRTGMALVGGDRVPDFREAQRFDAAAELALIAAIGACSDVLVQRTADQSIDERRELVRWSAEWPDADQNLRTSAWDLLRRLEAGTAFDPIVRQCMQGMDLDQQIIRTDLAKAAWAFTFAKSANLSVADLSNADLSGAFLIDANLSDAELSFANLSAANLHGVDLNFADLSGVDLREADLRDTDLTGANLRGANLHGVDLGRVRGLTKSQLGAAQTVDWDKVPADLPED